MWIDAVVTVWIAGGHGGGIMAAGSNDSKWCGA